jgi:hypothetical protein
MRVSDSKTKNFTWITEAPIQLVPPQNLHTVVETLRANVTSWYGETKSDALWSSDAKALGWGTGFANEKQWANRKESMQQMIWWPFHDAPFVFAYWLDGAPIALLSMTQNPKKTGTATVHGLVAHPGAQNAGSIMIEYALNFAVKQWSTTTLTLHSLDEESTKFYNAMGFEQDKDSKDKEDLILFADQRKGKEWTVLQGTWKLTAYLNLPFVLGPRSG